jgi:hypothetical protein
MSRADVVEEVTDVRMPRRTYEQEMEFIERVSPCQFRSAAASRPVHTDVTGQSMRS